MSRAHFSDLIQYIEATDWEVRALCTFDHYDSPIPDWGLTKGEIEHIRKKHDKLEDHRWFDKGKLDKRIRDYSYVHIVREEE